MMGRVKGDERGFVGERVKRFVEKALRGFDRVHVSGKLVLWSVNVENRSFKVDWEAVFRDAKFIVGIPEWIIDYLVKKKGSVSAEELPKEGDTQRKEGKLMFQGKLDGMIKGMISCLVGET